MKRILVYEDGTKPYFFQTYNIYLGRAVTTPHMHDATALDRETAIQYLQRMSDPDKWKIYKAIPVTAYNLGDRDEETEMISRAEMYEKEARRLRSKINRTADKKG